MLTRKRFFIANFIIINICLKGVKIVCNIVYCFPIRENELFVEFWYVKFIID